MRTRRRISNERIILPDSEETANGKDDDETRVVVEPASASLSASLELSTTSSTASGQEDANAQSVGVQGASVSQSMMHSGGQEDAWNTVTKNPTRRGSRSSAKINSAKQPKGGDADIFAISRWTLRFQNHELEEDFLIFFQSDRIAPVAFFIGLLLFGVPTVVPAFLDHGSLWYAQVTVIPAWCMWFMCSAVCLWLKHHMSQLHKNGRCFHIGRGAPLVSTRTTSFSPAAMSRKMVQQRKTDQRMQTAFRRNAYWQEMALGLGHLGSGAFMCYFAIGPNICSLVDPALWVSCLDTPQMNGVIILFLAAAMCLAPLRFVEFVVVFVTNAVVFLGLKAAPGGRGQPQSTPGESQDLVSYAIVVCVATVLGCFTNYFLEFQRRSDYRQICEVLMQKQNTEALADITDARLSAMVPPEAVRLFSERDASPTISGSDVAYALFSIDRFRSWAQQVSPCEVVMLLQIWNTEIDRLLKVHSQVRKLQVWGDHYAVIVGIAGAVHDPPQPETSNSHVRNPLRVGETQQGGQRVVTSQQQTSSSLTNATMLMMFVADAISRAYEMVQSAVPDTPESSEEKEERQSTMGDSSGFLALDRCAVAVGTVHARLVGRLSQFYVHGSIVSECHDAMIDIMPTGKCIALHGGIYAQLRESVSVAAVDTTSFLWRVVGRTYECHIVWEDNRNLSIDHRSEERHDDCWKLGSLCQDERHKPRALDTGRRFHLTQPPNAETIGNTSTSDMTQGSSSEEPMSDPISPASSGRSLDVLFQPLSHALPTHDEGGRETAAHALTDLLFDPPFHLYHFVSNEVEDRYVAERVRRGAVSSPQSAWAHGCAVGMYITCVVLSIILARFHSDRVPPSSNPAPWFSVSVVISLSGVFFALNPSIRSYASSLRHPEILYVLDRCFSLVSAGFAYVPFFVQPAGSIFSDGKVIWLVVLCELQLLFDTSAHPLIVWAADLTACIPFLIAAPLSKSALDATGWRSFLYRNELLCEGCAILALCVVRILSDRAARERYASKELLEKETEKLKQQQSILEDMYSNRIPNRRVRQMVERVRSTHRFWDTGNPNPRTGTHYSTPVSDAPCVVIHIAFDATSATLSSDTSSAVTIWDDIDAALSGDSRIVNIKTADYGCLIVDDDAKDDPFVASARLLDAVVVIGQTLRERSRRGGSRTEDDAVPCCSVGIVCCFGPTVGAVLGSHAVGFDNYGHSTFAAHRLSEEIAKQNLHFQKEFRQRRRNSSPPQQQQQPEVNVSVFIEERFLWRCEVSWEAYDAKPAGVALSYPSKMCVPVHAAVARGRFLQF